MRLFIAIPLPDSMNDSAKRLQDVLDKKIFRCTKQLDLTIAFLGEQAEAGSIMKKLENIRFHAFTLKTKGQGFFPSINKVRVVWIGLEENEEFYRLQHEIRGLFDFKEKLMPHITIARARSIIIDKENQWDKKISALKHDEIEFNVEKFILYESIPGPDGYIHKELGVFVADKV